jgi:hyaluronan synthase
MLSQTQTRSHAPRAPFPVAVALVFAALVGGVLAVGGGALLVIGGALLGTFALRACLWWRYRPVAPTEADPQRMPRVTVVVPAFNEAEQVSRCLESILASAYPTDRLEVVVVDDGSTDGTWRAIEAVRAVHPTRLVAIRLPRNRGKRHALYAGFARASGEVVVTVDSDCSLPPESLPALVLPFLRDPRVGAVAGRVLPLNRRENLLTRMLGVRYLLGFDFVRAYQSQLRTVWCCPGALQAYRREVISGLLDAWRDQRFLGRRCTNGDDHALTSAVLRLGYDTAYQSTATVYTLVPATYGRLVRMYLRWGRSATREGLLALGFTGQRAKRLGGLHGALVALDGLLQPLGILLRIAGLGAGLAVLCTSPLALLHGMLLTATFAVVQVAICWRSERSREAWLGVAYAIFAMLALPWIQPLATLTVRHSGWLTRG